MRASDADRDRVTERLREALAEGRLSPDEYAERIDSVLRAKTIGELAPITHDLPLNAPGRHNDESVGLTVSTEEARRLASESQGRENIVAIFGGAERGGRWLVEPRTNASVLFGSISLDFREAVLTQREVILQCAVIFGGLDIVVPHGVRVINDTTGILGGTNLSGTDSNVDPNAPTIRLSGTVLFGGIDAKARPPKKKRKWHR
ncbi:DUF1707 SHOCT-like domain-containing protein [Murinocardiopsis flavida]|nr:DUF1707 domain-containing protein [Murinocardiopsis flavida]